MRDISCYQIKFLVSRAFSVAIRLFAHEGQIKTPKMLSDNIGDRQNVSTILRCYNIFIEYSVEVYTSICSIHVLEGS